jgi:hypothetical protein
MTIHAINDGSLQKAGSQSQQTSESKGKDERFPTRKRIFNLGISSGWQ